eukprot:1196361-Prorocentrum_minimum.AAC.2
MVGCRIAYTAGSRGKPHGPISLGDEARVPWPNARVPWLNATLNGSRRLEASGHIPHTGTHRARQAGIFLTRGPIARSERAYSSHGL